MKNILVYVLCLTAVNCMKLVERDEATTPETITFAPYNIPGFQKSCREALMNAQELGHYVYPVSRPIKFVYPCEECMLEQIVYGPPYEETIHGMYIGKYFYINLTVNIKHYTVSCKCHIDDSDKDINNAFDEFKKEHYNTSCTAVDNPHPDTFNAEKVRACLNPKEADPDNANPTIQVKISEHDVDVALQMKDHVVKIHNSEKYTGYDPKEVRYEIMYKEFKEAKSPKVSCEAHDDEDSYEAKACLCLKQSSFFDAFPSLMSNHFFQCGKEGENVESMNYQISCREVADTYIKMPRLKIKNLKPKTRK